MRAVEVTHVFMSHLHYDHCVDFVRLYLNRWDQGTGTIPPLRMFGPPGFQRFVNRLFGPEGAFDPDLVARTHHPESLEVFRERGGTGRRGRPGTEVTELTGGDVVEGDGWRLSYVDMPHHQPYPDFRNSNRFSTNFVDRRASYKGLVSLMVALGDRL